MKRFVALLLSFAFIAPGCQGEPRDMVVVARHFSDARPMHVPVNYAGTYVVAEESDGDLRTFLSIVPDVNLRAGQSAGFTRDDHGGLVATAAGKRFPLKEGRYVWVYSPGDDPLHTALLFVGVVPLLPFFGFLLITGLAPRC